jgi:hypothetical protein
LRRRRRFFRRSFLHRRLQCIQVLLALDNAALGLDRVYAPRPVATEPEALGCHHGLTGAESAGALLCLLGAGGAEHRRQQPLHTPITTDTPRKGIGIDVYAVEGSKQRHLTARQARQARGGAIQAVHAHALQQGTEDRLHRLLPLRLDLQAREQTRLRGEILLA